MAKGDGMGSACWTFARRFAEFFRPPRLPSEAQRTYRFHLAYALLDAAAGGILLNAPAVAIRLGGSQNWQLPLREACVGIGVLATLYLSSWMAPRRKMPFVFIPGVLSGLFTMGMTFFPENALWWLTLFGLSAMFEIMTRPATATILRNCYPAPHRGHAMGKVRQWSSLAFLVMTLLTASLLEAADRWDLDVAVARTLGIMASALSLASFVCFSRIHDPEKPAGLRHDVRPAVTAPLRDAVRIMVRDNRYRRYLYGCLVDGFCGMLYMPLIWALLTTLGYGYFGSAVLMHVIPALTAFVATGRLGQWFDRSNPWISWAWVRFAWGVDAMLLAAALPLAAVAPAAVYVLPVAGRLLRGSVQGGQFVLWWQIGVTHFAPPGEDTSRYVGIMALLNGITRLGASLAGMALSAWLVSPVVLLVLGGLGVILSGVYSLWHAARERREHRPETIAQFEAQFAGPSAEPILDDGPIVSGQGDLGT